MWPSELDYLVQKSRHAEFQREAEHARLIRSLPRRASVASQLWAAIGTWYVHWTKPRATAAPAQRGQAAKVIQV